MTDIALLQLTTLILNAIVIFLIATEKLVINTKGDVVGKFIFISLIVNGAIDTLFKLIS